MPLFSPTMIKKRVSNITVEELRSMGVKGLLLDADNTLSTHGSQQPLPETFTWTKQMEKEGIKVVIVSNNHCHRVEPFARQFGLPFISNAKKPLPCGFRKAQKQMQMEKKELLVIGDQIFTDILGANLAGMKSALVEPIQPETGFFFRIKRRLERPFIKKLRVPQQTNNNSKIE